jgi:DNA-directed RNA polymerase beta subunit
MSTHYKTEHLDADGLPQVGAKLKSGDIFYKYIDEATKEPLKQVYKGEPAIVEKVQTVRGCTVCMC